MSGLQQVQFWGGPLDGTLQRIDLVGERLPLSIYIDSHAGVARYVRDPLVPVTGLVPVFRFDRKA